MSNIYQGSKLKIGTEQLLTISERRGQNIYITDYAILGHELAKCRYMVKDKDQKQV